MTTCPHGQTRVNNNDLDACNCCLRGVPLAPGYNVCRDCLPANCGACGGTGKHFYGHTCTECGGSGKPRGSRR